MARRSVGASNKAAEVYAKENQQVLQYPGLHVQVDNARNFLLKTDQQYDIINADAMPPLNASSWSSFTLEFYHQVNGHFYLNVFFSGAVTQHGNHGLFGHLANFSERVSYSVATRVRATCC